MAVWEEKARTWIQFKDWPFCAKVRPGEPTAVFCFYRFIVEPSEKPRPLRINSSTAVELLLTEQPQSDDIKIARDLAQASLAKLKSGELTYTEMPVEDEVKPTFVEDIASKDKLAFVRIIQWAEGRYEAKIQAYLPDGKYMPVQTPSISSDLYFSWCYPYYPVQFFCDNLAEMRQFAHAKLEQLVADIPEIKEVGPNTKVQSS